MAAANIIADTSIWIDHINKGDAQLAAQLKRGRILLHSMIVGEVALGSITRRDIVLAEMDAMPQARPASHAEVIASIERLELFNSGLGYVDVHLLASVRNHTDGLLWTRDARLHKQASRLGVAYEP